VIDSGVARFSWFVHLDENLLPVECSCRSLDISRILGNRAKNLDLNTDDCSILSGLAFSPLRQAEVTSTVLSLDFHFSHMRLLLVCSEKARLYSLPPLPDTSRPPSRLGTEQQRWVACAHLNIQSLATLNAVRISWRLFICSRRRSRRGRLLQIVAFNRRS
jgi:hypothetical protein